MSAVTYATAQILRVLPRARISRAVGRLAERRWPEGVTRAVVGLYSRAYDVSLDDCAEQGGWPSFDAFFTRRLRDGARSVGADPRTVLSPADGRIESMGRIDDGGTFTVKGRPYSVAELVGDAVEARRFVGGHGFVVYLSPRDYHRVHAPVGGSLRRVVSLPGDYYPVNAVGVRHVPALFCRNRRVAFEIDADGGIGRVTVVMVVAMIVGRITASGIAAGDVPLGVHTFDGARRIARGDELGVFHLGSTAVVLVERQEGRDAASPGGRAPATWLAAEGPVRYGAPLLAFPKRAAEAAEGRAPGGGP